MMVVIETLQSSHCRWRVLGIFAQMHIVPAGSVLKEMNHTDRIAGLPAVLVPEFRSEFVNRIIERELPLVDEPED